MVTGELGGDDCGGWGLEGERRGRMEGRCGGGMLSNSELFPLLSPGSSGLTLVLLSLAVAVLVPETPSIAPVSPHSYFGPTRSLVFNPPSLSSLHHHLIHHHHHTHDTHDYYHISRTGGKR